MRQVIGRIMASGTLAALTFSMTLHAQDFNVFDRTVQVHGFASQGYAYSNENNFLTMDTSHGSPAFTEGALNLSMPVTDKFRIGGQGYSRKIGSLDDFRPQLDWAYGDYKVARWFGVRAGKVKTAMGLYNDTQDMEFLHTWALLPQGVYPTDLRTTFIAHTGGDLYGQVQLKAAGKLEYTAYAGLRSFDNREGLYYFSEAGCSMESVKGRTEGGDVKWTTPVKGLMVGSSWANLTMNLAGKWLLVGPACTITASPDRVSVGYGNYTRGKWEFASEYRATNYVMEVTIADTGYPTFPFSRSTEAWFASAAYRVTPNLEVGIYHSNLHLDNPDNPNDTASNHIYDEVGTARYDVNRHWAVKAEGHFMDGYGDIYSSQGFYSQWNPQGLKPKTDMVVLKASYNF
jgi:hypothetical protein